MMQGHVDLSYQMLQRDLFASGMAAKIGMNAFGVWLAIKSHADFNTGEAWPGMRRLGDLTGLSLGAVSNSVRLLVEENLLRVVAVAKGKSHRGNTYVARERMEVRLEEGGRVLCTVVMDYVPAKVRLRLRGIGDALRSGKGGADVFAQCEIIPGEGFRWDSKRGEMRAAIPAVEFPLPELTDRQLKSVNVQKLIAMRRRWK